MAEGQAVCAICKTRRPRRACPGVRADTCTVCCGTEREVTVGCPLDCVYLREARAREKPRAEPAEFPNPQVQVSEAFLKRNESLLLFLASGLAQVALNTQGAIDFDVREALAACIRTYQTQQSGLVYEVRPDNPMAARVQAGLVEQIRDLEKYLAQNQSQVRDPDLIGILVFLQRLELQKNNGRRKGRAFIDFLREFFPPEAAKTAAEPSLIVL